MKRMKYVFNSKELKFVLIPEIGLAHNDISGEWTNAGMISFDISDGKRVKVSCYGKSVSLGLQAGEKDAEFIESVLNH